MLNLLNQLNQPRSGVWANLMGFSKAMIRSCYGRQLRQWSPPHRPSALPWLGPDDRQLLKQIQRRGVVETHLDTLQLADTDQMWAAAQALVPTLPDTHDRAGRDENDFEGHCVHADAAQFVRDYPEILLWGLGDRLLDLLENLMGCPPALIGVALRKDCPNGQQIGTRLWHMDGEDKHVLKILIYLNDVGQAEGPFEYVPKDRFNPQYRGWSRMLVRWRRGYNQNQGFEQIVKPKHWQSATGKAGTAILADTAKVFHHGAIATAGERLVLIFAYTTEQPRALALCKQFFPRADLLPTLATRLTPRQQACLLGWRLRINDFRRSS